jgi:hypothetical protein
MRMSIGDRLNDDVVLGGNTSLNEIIRFETHTITPSGLVIAAIAVVTLSPQSESFPDTSHWLCEA